LQYHHFELAQSRDALYNAAGVAIRRDPTGLAGTNVASPPSVGATGARPLTTSTPSLAHESAGKNDDTGTSQ
jgi:hypothetical protein